MDRPGGNLLFAFLAGVPGAIQLALPREVVAAHDAGRWKEAMDKEIVKLYSHDV